MLLPTRVLLASPESIHNSAPSPEYANFAVWPNPC